MLPENQFHSATSVPKTKQRSKFYTTQQVLELTLMSRFTLIRKVKEGIFPTPVNPGSKSANFYLKEEVDDWIQENVAWINKKRHIEFTEHNIRFDIHETKQIKTAAAALGCDLEKFINDAAVWKAKRIIDQLNIENNTEYYN